MGKVRIREWKIWIHQHDSETVHVTVDPGTMMRNRVRALPNEEWDALVADIQRQRRKFQAAEV